MTGQLLIAYFAGLFDGEGCVAARMEKNYSKSGRCFPMARAKVTVCMTDPRSLRLLQAEFGGSLHAKIATKPRHKTKWTWLLGNKASCRFLKVVLPFLVVKREEAELAIALQERMGSFPSRSYGRRGKAPLPQEEVTIRQQLVEKIKALKRREVV